MQLLYCLYWTFNSKCVSFQNVYSKNQHNIVLKSFYNIKGDVECFTPDNIVTADR